MEKRLMEVYCGDGKGKTTAAAGLAVRAAGNGWRVIFLQFMKGRESGEITILSKIKNISVIRNQKDFGFFNSMSEDDKTEITKSHNQNLQKALDVVEKGECDLLILDEVTYPYQYGLIDKKKLEHLVLHKPDNLELVLTGRSPAPIFLEQADYISEIMCRRHPYEKNIPARKGIEY